MNLIHKIAYDVSNTHEEIKKLNELMRQSHASFTLYYYDGKSNKYWNVKMIDPFEPVEITFGRIGSPGRVVTTNVLVAKERAEKKIKKGYTFNPPPSIQPDLMDPKDISDTGKKILRQYWEDYVERFQHGVSSAAYVMEKLPYWLKELEHNTGEDMRPLMALSARAIILQTSAADVLLMDQYEKLKGLRVMKPEEMLGYMRDEMKSGWNRFRVFTPTGRWANKELVQQIHYLIHQNLFAVTQGYDLLYKSFKKELQRRVSEIEMNTLLKLTSDILNNGETIQKRVIDPLSRDKADLFRRVKELSRLP